MMTDTVDPLQRTYSDIEQAENLYEAELLETISKPQSIRQRSSTILRNSDANTSTQPTGSLRRLQSFEDRELKKHGWWTLWGMEDFGSELLENNGAVARDHMANERTFLSWIRTSMAMATAGVGVTQLFKLVKDAKQDNFIARIGRPIGAFFVLIGVLCVLMGMFRFFRTQHLLKEDKYPPAKLTVSILVFFVFAACVVTLGAVLYTTSNA